MLLATACGGREAAPAIGDHPIPADHAAQVQAWRDKHERDYRRDWVSIANLHFLENGTHTVGSDAGNAIVVPHVPPVIGTLVVADGKVTFEPEAGVAMSQASRSIERAIGKSLPRLAVERFTDTHRSASRPLPRPPSGLVAHRRPLAPGGRRRRL